MLTCEERFKRLVDTLGLTVHQAAEIFGVEPTTAYHWYSGSNGMRFEFQQTLLRLEADNLPALSPKLRADTLQAFMEGRRRRAHGNDRTGAVAVHAAKV